MSLERLFRELWPQGPPQTSTVDLSDPEPATPAVRGASYVAFDLAGMELGAERWALGSYVPFAAFLIEVHGGDGVVHELPVLLDPTERLEALGDGGNAPAARVPLQDVPLVAPIPLLHPHLTLLGGLFRRVRSDVGDLLLNTLGELAAPPLGLVAATQVAAARVAYDGVKGLLGLADREARAAIYRGFRIPDREDASTGTGALTPGHVLLASGEGLSAGNVALAGGRPVGRDADADAALARSDWLSLRIRVSPRRGAYDDLPSHALWHEVAALVWQDRVDEAETRAFVELCRSVSHSAALTDDEKDELVAAYTAKLARERARREQALSAAAPRRGPSVAHRGGAPGGDLATRAGGDLVDRAAKVAQLDDNRLPAAARAAAAVAINSLADAVRSGLLGGRDDASGPDLDALQVADLDAVRRITGMNSRGRPFLAAATAFASPTSASSGRA